MNSDEFEQRLRRQPIRTIPEEWRTQILRSAAVSQSAGPMKEHSFSWRELFWPSPHAWAGLAAVWAVILVLNVASSESTTSPVAQLPPAPPSPQILIALELQRQLRAELMEIPEAAKPEKVEPARPRSEAVATNHHV
ncbi:MAG: hypothetical protein HY735_33395 [Verrucomicrobia bacterium]|nr:hypothetical protein [Verrucomicrobiota bacterium]